MSKRSLLAISLLTFVFLGAAIPPRDEKPIELRDQKTADHGFSIWAASKSDFPITIMVDCPQLENLSSSAKLPIIAVIDPHKSLMLSRFSRINARLATRFSNSWTWFYGFRSSKSRPEDFDYALPFKEGYAYRIVQGFDGKFSHQGVNAVDFQMPEGSTICASRAGVVIEVVESNTEGGTTEDMRSKANRVIILHDDGSTARYAHLKHNGASVKLGEKVRAGDSIGLSGATGYASGPHLHFEVNVPPAEMNEGKYDSVKTHFISHARGGNDIKVDPKEGTLVMRPYPPRDAKLHKYPENIIDQLKTYRRIENGKPVDATESFRADEEIIVSMVLNAFEHTALKLKVTRNKEQVCEFEINPPSQDHAFGVTLNPARINGLFGRCIIHITADGKDLATTPIEISG